MFAFYSVCQLHSSSSWPTRTLAILGGQNGRRSYKSTCSSSTIRPTPVEGHKYMVQLDIMGINNNLLKWKYDKGCLRQRELKKEK